MTMGRSVFAAALLLACSCLAAPTVSELRRVSPPSLARTAEFAFHVKAEYENPFDPDQIRVDAEVTGPAGRLWIVPAFWMQPCAMQVGAAERRFASVTFMQFYVNAATSPRGKPVRFAFSDAALEDSASGRRRPLTAFTDPRTWACAAGVTTAPGVAPDGKPALIVTIVPNGKGYPGIRLAPKGGLSDWSGSDTLRFLGQPIDGVLAAPVTFEMRRGKRKNSFRPFKGSRRGQGWRPCAWRFDRGLASISWSPPAQGEWRLRVAAPTTGTYRIALSATDRTGAAAGQPHAFDIDKTAEHGFIRVAPECPRYLRYDSGEPFFSVGTNLLVFTDDFAEYVYYFDKFTRVGVNLFRVWLDTPRLGFEKKTLVRYEPRECAVLDALVNAADSRGATLMLCLLDHREVIERKNLATGGWERNPYHTVCDSASAFFTDEDAKRAFRKRLRYLVARWSASPAVHSWEFFNEVAYSDAWRRAGAPDTVRAWHAEMAAELRRIDPYDHMITTSLGGSKDDPLWAQSLMEIIQPHCYQTASVDFASFLRGPCIDLARQGKPVLLGEFGLMTVKYEDVLEGGVSVHNGMWASVMSGCCGTAMPWWWEWIDRHDHYPHVRGVAEFVKGVRWHEQAFAPIPDGRLTVAVPAPDAAAPGTVGLTLVRHTWDATAPYNRPTRIWIHADGSTDPVGCVSTRLHGLRNHRDCHNPKTFMVDYPLPGRFVVGVGSVSGYGGADLRIRLDGKDALFKAFADEDKELENVMQQYRGDYGIDVPAGAHEIEIVNRGNDWITLTHIRLGNYGSTPPAVHAMGLSGKDTVLLWVRNGDYTWFGNMTKQPCRTIEGARLTLRGLGRGAYDVRFYAPQTASWSDVRRIRAQRDDLELALPSFAADMAVAVSRSAGD